MKKWTHLRGVIVSVAVALLCFVNTPARPASAVATGLWVAPPDVAVTSGGAFSVQLMQHADVATNGAQFSFNFDRTRLQVTGAVIGAPYGSAFFGVTDLAQANTATGVLSVGTFIMPGSGTLPFPPATLRSPPSRWPLLPE